MPDSPAERLRVLRSPEIIALMPSLTAYAARVMGIAHARDGTELAIRGKGPADFALDAVFSWVDGDRIRPEGVELGTFLRGVIRSQVDAARRGVARNEQSVEVVGEPVDAALPADEQVGAVQAMERIEKELEGDAKVRALYDLIADGDGRQTYAEYAEKLATDERDIKNRFARLIGRLARAGFKKSR